MAPEDTEARRLLDSPTVKLVRERLELIDGLTDEEFEETLEEQIEELRQERRGNGSTKQEDDIEIEKLKADRKAQKCQQTMILRAEEAGEKMVDSILKYVKKNGNGNGNGKKRKEA